MVSPAVNVSSCVLPTLSTGADLILNCICYYLKVVRYTALASGVLYGIVHRRTLTSQEKQKHELHEAHRREKLLEQAREAWKEKTSASMKSRTLSRCGSLSRSFRTTCCCYGILTSRLFAIVITDPENPKFDLEALAAAYDKQ